MESAGEKFRYENDLENAPLSGPARLLPWNHNPSHRFLALIIYCEMIEANNIRIYLEITFQLSIKN